MKKLLVFFAAVVLLLAACRRNEDFDYDYVQPPELDDGIATGSLASVGMDPVPLRRMMDRINGTDMHRIHDILIMKDGRLVFEEYFPGFALDMNAASRDGEWLAYGRDTAHFMASVSKSVTSAIVGIAVGEGLLPDLERTVRDCFPEYADILTGEKAGITLRHLITMTSGLAFDENTYPYGDERNDITRMFSVDDPIRFVLAKPLTSAPGERFFYNSGTVNVLAAAVARAAGAGFLAYANDRLFAPLGEEGGRWQTFRSGDVFASGGLFLRARDLAKIGQVFIDDGSWHGAEIVPAGWVALSQQEHVATSGFGFAFAYGYLWWIRNFTGGGVAWRCYFAAGWGDQYLFILPELRLAIVFNCGNYAVNARLSPFDLVEDYILAAL